MNARVSLDAEGILIAALEQVVDAVAVIDDARTVIFFNAAAERLWGFDRTEVMGEPVGTHLPQLAKLMAEGTPGPRRRRKSVSEIAIRRADSTTAIISVSVSPIASANTMLLMVVARDVTDEARRRDEMRLLSLATDETDRVVLIMDADRRIVYANRAFADVFGYSSSEVIGQRSRDVFMGRHAKDEQLGRLRERIEAGNGFHEELFVRDKAGRNIWVHAAINPIFGENGKLRNIVAVLANVTEGKQLQVLQRDVLEALASDSPLEAVMRLICEQVEAVTPDVVCSVVAVDEERRLRPLAGPNLPAEISAAVDGQPIGPSAGSCGTAAWRGEPVLVTDIAKDPLWAAFKDVVLPYGFKACWSSPITLRDGKVAGTFAFYFKERRGPSAWHEMVVAACLHLCVLAFERRAAKADIARLAYYDTLTGLPNRAQLRDMLHARINAERRGREITVLFLDVDRFKDVNDTLGHSVGDRLLAEIARRLRRHVAHDDVVSRYGGDEFVVMLGDNAGGRAGRVAGRLIEQLLEPVVIENMLLPVSASIGISVFPTDGSDEDMLLKHADTAMSEAKSAGGGSFRFFSPEMNNLAQERLVLGAALREAISRQQLRLNYQPQVDCRSGALRGVEALARWTHPIFGEVSPARFIALAEECGLIEAIGQWALNEACGQLATWRRAGLEVPCISVNLSPVQFRNEGLTQSIADLLGQHGLEPGMLTVEITEGLVMDDNPTAIETAKAIHDLGVGLSVDDFGTGYSSLSYLARLPVDELKIDRSFMRDLEADRNAQAVVTAVVRIGQSLNLKVVAEGVESEAQRRFLDAIDCDILQGFLVSKGLAPEAFEAWYAAQRQVRAAAPFSGAA